MLFDDGVEVQFFHRFDTDSFSDPALSEASQPLMHSGRPLQNGGTRLAPIDDQAPEVASTMTSLGLREWQWGSGLSRLDHRPELGGGLGAALLGWLSHQFLYDPPPSSDAGSLHKDSISLASETIVVTGTRPPPYDPYTDGSGGSLPGYTDTSGDTASTETGGESTCTCAGMTEAEKREQAIDAEVAKVLDQILAKANQAMEYGSLIWIDRNGTVRHTPLIPSPDEKARIDTSELPSLPDGRTDFSGVVAMVHSHPRYIAYNDTTYYDPTRPERLLVPWEGDWASFDSYSALITSTGGNASTFQQYIIGFSDGKLLIKQYNASDKGTVNASDGDSVDPDTEACTC